MTEALERAFEAASKLPPSDQDALAALILDEIDSEKRWEELFARSGSVLRRMADEALAEHGAGLTKPLNPDDL